MKSDDARMELVRRYLSGESTREEASTLESMLAADAQLRRDFVRYARVDARLSALATPRLLRASPPKRLWLKKPFAAFATAAAVLFVAIVWRLTPVTARHLGTVTNVLNMEASGDGNAPAVGQPVRTGRLLLNRGAMEITLSNGVTLLCEGPGELELLSNMRVLLHSGQVVVRVPAGAIGFELDAASAHVQDLGTEFAVKAASGLETDVQVYEGLVEANPPQGGFASRLEAGSAARFTPVTSKPKELVYSESRFLRRIPPEPGVPMPGKGGDEYFHPAQHAELVIPSRTSPIVVDGDLSDWTPEERFFSRRDSARSVEGRMRYDRDAIYIAAHIQDPAPMRNSIDPSMDGEFGWRGGGLQVRLSLDRELGWPVDASSPGYYRMRKLEATPEQIARASNHRLVSLTLWHHEPTSAACMHVAYGFDYHTGVVNPPGFAAVFQRDADGRGYTLEARVPWFTLGVEQDPPQAGDTLAVCWQTHWADPTGRIWSSHLVELRNPSEPLRISNFERAATWGRAIYR